MSKYPHAPQTHNLMGIILEKKEEHAAAMKHFRAALALDPTYYPAKHNLDMYGSEIDYIVTHETPLSARACIKRQKPVDDDYILPNIFEEWYKLCLQENRFKKWYFGHMHADQEITDRLQAVFNQIHQIV